MSGGSGRWRLLLVATERSARTTGRQTARLRPCHHQGDRRGARRRAEFAALRPGLGAVGNGVEYSRYSSGGGFVFCASGTLRAARSALALPARAGALGR